MTAIHFVASQAEGAQQARQEMIRRYGDVATEAADVIVAIGGDGFILQTMHRTMDLGKPIYGLMQGSVGFLMNQFEVPGVELPDRLSRAETAKMHPLRMTAQGDAGTQVSALAFNEVALFRQTKQAAKIRVKINGAVKLEEMISDGILLATPAGSTAYNLSAGGPIVPLGANILALTPLSPFRPRRWRGALLLHHVTVSFEVLDHYKRPVSATADAFEMRDVVEVSVEEAKDVTVRMLFDPEHNLEDRILNEQFTS